MNVTYHINAQITAEEFRAVLAASGINRPIDDLPRLQRMLDQAQLIVTARDDDDAGKLIGIARSLTDFCFACYMSDLAVDRAYQNRGIGRQLIDVTRHAISDQTTLLLIAAPTADAYYPKVGFDRLERGWLIPRQI